MELADPKILNELCELTFSHHLRGQRLAKVQAAATKPAYTAPSHARRRRCLCGGICPRCLEDARWERIFRAKFADPTYYAPRPLRHASALDNVS